MSVTGKLVWAAVAALAAAGGTAVPGSPAAADSAPSGSSAAAAPVPIGPDLVVNGSFEQPDIPFNSFIVTTSVPGWSWALAPQTVDAHGIEIQDRQSGGPAPGAGDQFAELDSDGPLRLSQGVATEPGTAYRLTFLATPRPGTAAAQNDFTASAGSASVRIGPVAGGARPDWQARSLDFVASDSSTEIAFLDHGPEEGPFNGLGALLDLVSVHELNSAPACDGVSADRATLWPADNKLHPVALSGATDADGDAVTLAIGGVTQDEAVGGAPDAAAGDSADSVLLRAQRDGDGDGRVYTIAFTATDARGLTCTGSTTVSVPHDQRGAAAVDSGATHDSTVV